MLTRDEAQKLTARALSFSTFPECDISLTSSETAFTRFALNGVTTSGFTAERSLYISSTRDGKTGNTEVDEFDDKSLRDAVRRTEELAMISPANPEHAPQLPPQKYHTVENFAATTNAARNKEMIPHIRAIIETSKKNGLVAAGFFERTSESSAIANKRGNFGYHTTTDASLSATVRKPDGSSSGWASHPAVRIEEINGEEIARIAVRKCLQWSKPKRLEPGKYTVILEPTAVGDLIGVMGYNFNARRAEEGRSFLSRKGGGTLAGEKLFPETITLRTDPFNRLYPGSPWDYSGLPCAPTTWIGKGVVRNLWYDRYWAGKTGREATPYPSDLVLEGGDKSLADLVAEVERGLLVTRFWYIRVVNPQTAQLTGLTRDGLFLVENGKVTTPVVNFRFNESPVRLLQNTVALGKPVRTLGGEVGMIAPPLVAHDFPFTSISDAV
jgi:predicted Zn-dependent protease